MSFAHGSNALKRQLMGHGRKRAKGTPKFSTISIYVSVFVFISAVVAVGYSAPKKDSGLVNITTLTSDTQEETTSVNELVATNIAANLAATTNLSVANNVANLSVSLAAKDELAQAEDTLVTKPQILQPTAESRAVTAYTVKRGDTVDTVADKFGRTKNTIKWANNLSSDALIVGTTLKILPTDGILYTAKSEDTLESIAKKYNVDKARIVLYNDLDVSGLKAGKKIILPGGILPDTERPGYVAPQLITQAYDDSTGYNEGYNTDRGSAGNRYSFGYCTWYAYERRAQLGMPIGSFWGDASSWSYAARSSGYTVNSTPSAGAIMQNGGGAGHVAIIEGVEPNGDVSISEMNNSAYGGWNIKSYRTMSAGQAASYLYIH
jgi:surface antigen